MSAVDLGERALEADRRRLLALLTEKSYAKKKVVLSSGRESDFYVDCKKTVLTAEGHWLVGRLLLDAISRNAPAAVGVGGLTMGADPLASAVSLVSHLAQRPLQAFLVRKEPKGHGTGQWIEGRTSLADGAKVAIVEDVVTTGASTIKAVERARAEGLTPVGAFALVDRLEGGREAIAALGVPVFALFTREDFPR
ncbi:MAG: orotate phosphoribosyltransferase [Myxococcaceae bacterium]|nr:orotate phosphoribosyltransferase [Myxococcaceae bacterium]